MFNLFSQGIQFIWLGGSLISFIFFCYIEHCHNKCYNQVIDWFVILIYFVISLLFGPLGFLFSVSTIVSFYALERFKK